MRNISLAATVVTSLPSNNVTSTTIDVDDNVLYAASEHQNPDANVQVSIWKVPLVEEGGVGGQVSVQDNRVSEMLDLVMGFRFLQLN
jgi:hypothetical protein